MVSIGPSSFGIRPAPAAERVHSRHPDYPLAAQSIAENVWAIVSPARGVPETEVSKTSPLFSPRLLIRYNAEVLGLGRAHDVRVDATIKADEASPVRCCHRE